MDFIEPHIHMVSRTTDDYERLALAGCVAMTEPAFWAGYDRTSVSGFYDYYRQLTESEPRRAARFGIEHHSWICMNPKEAEDAGFAREVLSIIPEFLDRPGVVGVGEIGLNKNTKNEMAAFESHVSLALERDKLILIHTPHLEDKRKGTLLILDALDSLGADPRRVLIDHAEEHTVGVIRDRGYWAGMTLYPVTKCTPQRAADIIETFGPEGLWVNSSGDWGPSDPLSVPLLRLEMRRRGHSLATIHRMTYANPLAFLSQSGQFRVGGKAVVPTDACAVSFGPVAGA